MLPLLQGLSDTNVVLKYLDGVFGGAENFKKVMLREIVAYYFWDSSAGATLLC